MRRLLGVLALFILVFLLLSLLLPTHLELKKEIRVFNNKTIVYRKLQDMKFLQKCLVGRQKGEVTLHEGFVYWEEFGRNYSCHLAKKQQESAQVIWLIQNLQSKEVYRMTFDLKELEDRLVRVSLQLESQSSLNPLMRYRFGWYAAELRKGMREVLLYLKEQSEQEPYERFYLSEEKIELLDQMVFAISSKTATRRFIKEKNKVLRINRALEQRMFKYKLIDTSQLPFLQYTQWNDSLVQYNICLPLLKLPTRGQSFRLREYGNLQRITGGYYTAYYRGKGQDLSLAWDSLYFKLQQTCREPEGFPLEQLLSKTDTLEQCKLFIRLR